MLFNSYKFILFFPIVITLYFAVPVKAKQPLLLIASYFFYMSWNVRHGLLLLGATVVSYFGAISIDKFQVSSERKKQVFSFAASIIFLFSSLFVFKYLNFSLSVLQKVLSLFRSSFTVRKFDIILPVGISFFTFQTAGYLIDVWRGSIKAERNFIQYALFVSFFPQLVAGPIERSKNLLYQLKKPQVFDFDLAKDGVFQMIWGYFLKMVIADRAAILVDAVYNDIYDVNGMVLIIATVLFSFQIYCDFAGYSAIARGAAQILGIRLTRNFDSPYCALSIRDFWRRWHISLGSWFRDYLYYSVGFASWNKKICSVFCARNRRKLAKATGYMALFCVWLATGLWHGAGLHFIAWGCLHGIYIIFSMQTETVRSRLRRKLGLEKDGHVMRIWHCIQAMMTFILVNISYVFFRSYSLKTALYALKKMLTAVITKHGFKSQDLYRYFSVSDDVRRFRLSFTFDEHDMHLVIVCIAFLLLVDYISYKGISPRTVLAKQNPVVQILAVALAVTFISIFGIWGSAFSTVSFIYFQF